MIHHGDCIEWLATLPTDSADVCIMDPPYEAEAHTKARRSLVKASRSQPGNRGVRKVDAPIGIDFAPITEAQRSMVATGIARVTKRWIVAFCQIEAIAAWRSCFEAAGIDWVRGGIWRKPDASPQFTGDRPGQGFECIAIAHRPGRKRWNGGGKHAVWQGLIECDRSGKGDKNPHPTMKPLTLMTQLVADFSNPGELIIDPFAGSGSTGVAALRMGRRFIGCEMQRKYVDLANERLRAEELGTTVAAARSGQVPMFGGLK